jgi:hypothetical protein
LAKWKAIKPGPFKQKEMLKALRVTMKEWGEQDAIPAFDAVTTGWQGERPYWIQIYRAGATWLENIIQPSELDSPSANKWRWLDKGTPPHVIAPKKEGGLLVFPVNYFPGSYPGILQTKPGVERGPLIGLREVNHPGIEPRGWTDMLVEKLAPTYQEAAELGMERAAKASGHGME